jgi:hypothetical protein
MLLTELPFGFTTPTYRTTLSSPLAERSANACPRYVSPFMASDDMRDAQKQLPFSKRAIKSVPFVKDRQTASERRRELFKRNVGQRREDQRWERREIPDQVSA